MGQDAEDCNRTAAEGGDLLDADEMVAAIGALTAVDLRRLALIGRMLIGPNDADDLLAEAVRAAIEGRRHCPRGVRTPVFLANAMKSLASSEKKKAGRAKVIPFPVTRGEGGSTIDMAPDPSPNPEQALIEREDELDEERVAQAADRARSALMTHFEADYQAQLCIEGMLGELKGEELRELVGVDQARLDYTRKKIRRAAMKLSQKGWRNA